MFVTPHIHALGPRQHGCPHAGPERYSLALELAASARRRGRVTRTVHYRTPVVRSCCLQDPMTRRRARVLWWFRARMSYDQRRSGDRYAARLRGERTPLPHWNEVMPQLARFVRATPDPL